MQVKQFVNLVRNSSAVGGESGEAAHRRSGTGKLSVKESGEPISTGQTGAVLATHRLEHEANLSEPMSRGRYAEWEGRRLAEECLANWCGFGTTRGGTDRIPDRLDELAPSAMPTHDALRLPKTVSAQHQLIGWVAGRRRPP